MNDTMEALVFTGPPHLELQNLPIPAISPDEVLVKVRAASICGTDLRIIDGRKTRGVRIPSILGHEFAGEIAAAGSQVQEFQAGERVVVAPIVSCQVCYACQDGLSNICLNRVAIGYEFDGGFAQYIRIPAVAVRAGNVFKLPAPIAFEEAALIEPLSCCICSQRKLPVKEGDSVLIIGAGPIGLMHLKLALMSGAAQVIVVDRANTRLEAARTCGATTTINPVESDLQRAVLQETGKRGCDQAILAASDPTVIPTLLSCVRKGGGVMLFAGTDVTTIDANVIHYNQVTLAGSSGSALQDFRTAIDSLQSNRLNLKDLVTHQYLLSDFHKAFAIMSAGEGLKVQFVFEADEGT